MGLKTIREASIKMELDHLEEKGVIGTTRIKELLKTASLIFIVDDTTSKKWIPKDAIFNFWRDEVKNRIVEPKQANRFELDKYPGSYCFIAREHKNTKDVEDTTVYIVLEIVH